MTKHLVAGIVSLVWFLGAMGLALPEQNPDTGPGCGLGKLAWADYEHPKNIAPQVMMATTNGTFGSTTFGISSGTSGCTNDGTVMAKQKVNMFTASNFDNLAQEMAKGEGEHLASLATLMGIPEDNHPEFFAMTQQNYTSLIRKGESSPTAVIKALNDSMATQPVLAKLTTNR